MFDDLIQRLRTATKLPMLQALMDEAADAIEALVGAEKRKTEKDAPLTDYISREAVKEFIRSYRSSTDIAFHMEEHLSEIPAADVRPVVLCKDCRHRDPEDHKCDCGQLERAGCVFPVDDDYFCAYGER